MVGDGPVDQEYLPLQVFFSYFQASFVYFKCILKCVDINCELLHTIPVTLQPGKLWFNSWAQMVRILLLPPLEFI